MGARTDVPRTDDFLRTQISWHWMHGLLNFLTRGAPLSSLRARESSAIISRKEFWVIFPSPNSFQSRRLPPGLGFNFTQQFLHFGIKQQLLHVSKVGLHLFMVILLIFALRMHG